MSSTLFKRIKSKMDKAIDLDAIPQPVSPKSIWQVLVVARLRDGDVLGGTQTGQGLQISWAKTFA